MHEVSIFIFCRSFFEGTTLLCFCIYHAWNTQVLNHSWLKFRWRKL